MSTIAWDGKTLAADCQVTCHETPQKCSKIKKLSDGTILGTVGSLSTGAIMMRWYEDGADLMRYPHSQGDKEDWSYLIVVKPDGEVLEYSRHPYPRIVSVPFGWGSGRDYALGAMEMGADAIKAVEISCKLDIHTGMGVESFSVGGAE